MLFILLWCLFNKYVVIICPQKGPLEPPLSFLHDLCCKQILCPLSVHHTLLILCTIEDLLETVFVFLMQLCYMCISVKCQPANSG